MSFRYRPGYDIPRKWQEYMYVLVRLYDDLPGNIKLIIDTCLAEAGYPDAVYAVVVRDMSHRLAAADSYMDDTTLRRHVRKFYCILYQRLKYTWPSER